MSPTVRTPDAAVKLVLADFRRTASCVTDAVLVADRVAGEPRVAITFGGRSGRARANRRRVWLSTAVELEPRQDDDETGGWRTHALMYEYSVFGDERGADEWLTYHYHPLSGVSRPHLHVNADASWISKGLRRRHLPTGRVSFEDFVQFLIEELGVSPRREKWERVLDENRRIFAERRKW